MNMPRIVPGTTVAWESQSGGFVKRKEGIILAFLPAGSDALVALTRAGESGRLMGERVSKVDRYLVRVRTGPRTVRYYTPRADVVERSVRAKAYMEAKARQKRGAQA